MKEDAKLNFEIPGEMRELAQQSVEQAQKAVSNFIAASRKAAVAMEGQGAVAQANAKNATEKAMEFAEQNVTMWFEFARKLVHARDVTEIPQIQTDFVKAQAAAVREQVKALGQTAA